jgi:hypothetical protein
MSYYETPVDVLEDAAELVAWARRSVAAAMAAAKPAKATPRVKRATRGAARPQRRR